MSIKKFLLTSALVAGFAGSAFAHQHLTVTLGGSIDTQVGFRDQDEPFEYLNLDSVTTPSTTELSDAAIVNDTRLNFKVDADNGKGLKYGGLVVLNADASTNKFSKLNLAHSSSGGGLNVGDIRRQSSVELVEDEDAYQTMIYAETMYGRLEAGSYTGAYNALKVNAGSIARATGGINGDTQYWVNPLIMTSNAGTYGFISDRFWVNPNLPSNYDTGGQDNAAKATYYTPTWMGFKAGLTFIPDMEQKGTVARTHVVLEDISTGNLPYKGVVSGGIHYAGHFQKIHVKAALLGESGEAKSFNTSQGREDLSAWEAGLSLGYNGFTVAGSYAAMDDSGLVNAASGTTAALGKDDTNYWTLGAAYEYGHAGVSVTYLNSQRGLLEGINTERNKFTNWSIGVDYKLAPGFMPYAEISFYDLDERNQSTVAADAAQQENDGTVFLAGTKLMF